MRDPSQHLECMERLIELNIAIEKVARRSWKSGQALVFCLAGLSHAEAAELAGCRATTMKMRLCQGLKYLSEEMVAPAVPS